MHSFAPFSNLIFPLKIADFLQNFATFSKIQLDSFVDFEKPEKMRLWLQNFVSIQPRTSLEKSDVSWPTAQYLGSV